MRWGLRGRREVDVPDDDDRVADDAGSSREGGDEIVILMQAPNEPMAHYWSDLLDEAGIKAMIRPGGAGIGAWGSAATLEHDILVLTSQLDAAREIVEQAESDEPEREMTRER
jgi:hypothetical protein